MEIWFINLGKSLETLTFLIFLKELDNSFKKVGHVLNIMRQTACLVCNPDNYTALFCFTVVVKVSD